MRRAVFGLLVLLGLMGPANADDGPPLITITGSDISDGIGPGGDRASLFEVLGIQFDDAIALSSADLAALDQTSFPAQISGYSEPVMVSGPLLADVVATAGLEGDVAVYALDGYSAVITADLMAEARPVLATHISGVPFMLGGLGPTLIAFPQTALEADAELEALQVWAVFHIRVD